MLLTMPTSSYARDGKHRHESINTCAYISDDIGLLQKHFSLTHDDTPGSRSDSPGSWLLVDVLNTVSDDVGLLQDRPLVIGQVIRQLPPLQLAHFEQLRSTAPG